jgi:hypothetical protein
VSEESLRRPEKCSGRSSLAARNRWQDQWCQGTTGGGYRQWGAHGGRRWQGNSHCPALLAGATGRLLVQEGHGDEALLFVWSDNSKAARRRLAMACEVVVSAEQSSKEAAVEQCEGEAKWVVASSADRWAWHSYKIPPISKLHSNLQIQKEAFPTPQIFKFWIGLDLNILINSLNWVNYKFSTEFTV